MNINGRMPRRFASPAVAIISVLLAARLFVPAAALAFSRRSIDEFNATGLPAWTRLALALPEMFGAVLLAIPATSYLGAGVLFLDLTGAIAAHRAIGMQPAGLYLLLAAVSTLVLARRALLKCKPQR